MIQRGQGFPSETFTQGLGEHRCCVRHQDGECKGWHSSQVLLGWGRTKAAAPCLALGPSRAAALVILWSLIAETTAGSSHSKATIHLQTVWGRGCLLSAAIWASSIGSRLWTHSVGRGGVCSVPLVGFLCSGLALYQRISSAFPLLLFRTEGPCISHDVVAKVEPVKSSAGILPFRSGYSVWFGTTDSTMVTGVQGLLRQEPLIQTACVCSYKHAADITFITYSSANIDVPCEPCPDFHPL